MRALARAGEVVPKGFVIPTGIRGELDTSGLDTEIREAAGVPARWAFPPQDVSGTSGMHHLQGSTNRSSRRKPRPRRWSTPPGGPWLQ